MRAIFNNTYLYLPPPCHVSASVVNYLHMDSMEIPTKCIMHAYIYIYKLNSEKYVIINQIKKKPL